MLLPSASCLPKSDTPTWVQGFRVGVMRQVIDTSTADSEFTALFNDALSDLASAGGLDCTHPLFSLCHLASCLADQTACKPAARGVPSVLIHTGLMTVLLQTAAQTLHSSKQG